MRTARIVLLAAAAGVFGGCASGGGSFLSCVPIVCSFVGSPPARPAPPAPARAAAAPAANPCTGRIVLRGVTFAFDSAQLDGASLATLDVAAEQLAGCSDLRIAVEGHTDSMGGDGYNEALSQRRAESVSRYLAGRGVAIGRLVARGFGESRPVASNDTAEGRALNRRVELAPLR